MSEDVYETVHRWKISADPAERIAAAIWRDVTDRRGWRQEADQFDAEIKVEIINTWVTLIRSALSSEPGEGR